ncbi:MAG: hypothetical protein PHC61_15930 [Chitinivibrionales bacterium]|nr:hypothetical protein [Chitinivibrionales bacterium]
MKNFVFCGFVVLAVAMNLWAVDGIAVTVRNPDYAWRGNNLFGDIYRIDIAGSDTVKTTKIVSKPASHPHISPDGKRVAFTKPDTVNGIPVSYICIMSIDGGTITKLCPCNVHSSIDFPTNDWIYWNNGTRGTWASDSDLYIFRVNTHTGQREFVTYLRNPQDTAHTYSAEGEDLDVDTGLTRLCIHPYYGGVSGGYIIYFFSWGTGKWDCRYALVGCGGGMSFDGRYLFIGIGSHTSNYVININYPGGFADTTPSYMACNSTNPIPGAVVKFVDFGNEHEINSDGGSRNSADWLCRCLINYQALNYLDAQCLVNWVTGEQIITGVGNGGDFWIGTASQNTAMVLNPASLSFAAEKGGASPAAQTVRITNSGSGTLNPVTTGISFTSGSGWLTVSAGGTGNAQTLTNTVTPGSLAIGSYQATVTVSCGNAQPASAVYSVALQVTDPSLTLANVTVTPAKCTTSTWSTIPFTAVATAGTGAIVPPAFKWTVSDGQSIDSTRGIFSAGSTSGGPYTVTASATYKGVTKSATATVLVYRPVTITMPVQGATYKIGDTLTISWTRLANTTTTGLDIQLTTSNGLEWGSLIQSVLIKDGNSAYYKGNVGTLKWVIPKSITGPSGDTIQCAANQCKVRLYAPYDYINETEDVSAAFIIAGTSAISRPSGNLVGRDRSGKSAAVVMYDIRGRKIANIKNAHSGVFIEQISGLGARLIVNTERRNNLP